MSSGPMPSTLAPVAPARISVCAECRAMIGPVQSAAGPTSSRSRPLHHLVPSPPLPPAPASSALGVTHLDADASFIFVAESASSAAAPAPAPPVPDAAAASISSGHWITPPPALLDAIQTLSEPYLASASGSDAARTVLLDDNGANGPVAPASSRLPPMCAGCVALLEAAVQRELADRTRELEMYEALVRELTSAAAATEESESAAAVAAETAALEAEIADLESQLADANAADTFLAEREWQLRRADREASDRERALWRGVNAYHTSLAAAAVEREAVNAAYAAAAEQLEKLSTTNVVFDVFRIWYDGQYGTIDGFRLGRHPTQPVEWPEINAGWGQACLMLDTLARMLQFTFAGFRLIPMGSTSKIQKLSTTATTSAAAAPSEPAVITTFDLYCRASDPPSASTSPSASQTSSSTTLLKSLSSRLLHPSTFDRGLAAYLQCLGQLVAHCATVDKQFRAPYAVEGDRIGGVPITTKGSGKPADWARACKYVLTNLRWIMSTASRVDAARSAPPKSSSSTPPRRS
ncbi:autophagy protein Apg6-domain-containing protein [Blastocladiella britannica]|nr:autophagy protein Apg6-domain-containing protein [Blastocladiella britannica]